MELNISTCVELTAHRVEQEGRGEREGMRRQNYTCGEIKVPIVQCSLNTLRFAVVVYGAHSNIKMRAEF